MPSRINWWINVLIAFIRRYDQVTYISCTLPNPSVCRMDAFRIGIVAALG